MIFWRRVKMPDYDRLAALEREVGAASDYYQTIADYFSMDAPKFVTGDLSTHEIAVLTAMGYQGADVPCLGTSLNVPPVNTRGTDTALLS